MQKKAMSVLDNAKKLVVRLHELGTQIESKETDDIRDELDVLCLTMSNDEMAELRSFIVQQKNTIKRDSTHMETSSFVILVTSDTGTQYLHKDSMPGNNKSTAYLIHALMGEEGFMKHQARLHSAQDEGKKFETAEIVLTMPRGWL